VRPHGSLWSLAVNPNVATCVQELRKLFDRTIRAHAFTIAIATAPEATSLFPSCDRSVLLTDRATPLDIRSPRGGSTPTSVPLFRPETWESALEAIMGQNS
jgi:hypothetical protein